MAAVLALSFITVTWQNIFVGVKLYRATLNHRLTGKQRTHRVIARGPYFRKAQARQIRSMNARLKNIANGTVISLGKMERINCSCSAYEASMATPILDTR
jgi:hypothetical protein